MNGHYQHPQYQRGDYPQSGQPQRYPYDDRLVYRPIIPRPPEAIQRPPLPLYERPSRWPGVICFLLSLIAAVLVLLNLASIKEFFATMEHAGSQDPVQQIKGLSVFGIVLVSILAAMRIALNRGRKEK